MSKIKDIQNAVTSNGMREWTDQRVRQAMREYAKAVAADALKRVVYIASNISIDRHGVPLTRSEKKRILYTEINTDL